ncbi:MAG: class I SAM-dependent methyltransferase [Jatrophihabitantaceae bacterium]
MGRERDVAAFDARAERYDRGRVGGWHGQVVDATCRIALTAAPRAASVLDVGCGTGRLLRMLASGLESASELTGVDPSASMIEVARRGNTVHNALAFVVGAAEALPVPDDSIDLIVTTTSFDHWADQGAGLSECHRVLRTGGRLVLADLIAPTLWPTTVVGRRGKARTPRQVARLLDEAALRPEKWQKLSTMIRAVTATAT